ncbi:hypothetical protein PILCRDRAFT_800403 [Piloderma croceum F 1598]|uniref:Transmembrane protein n=1 Tax=Piloderma croceum (strain F 1598) TaxID=765440 RepID=A0A0C3EQE3_PILCF|nr:hypothetical protein PILCRDRAFT_800403 [Piloderma croceum F 1598]
MAPWNITNNNNSYDTSPSAAIAQASQAVTRPEGGTVGAKTIFGIVFALVCFAVITGVFIAKRGDHTRPWLERLKRIFPMLQRQTQSRSEATVENSDGISLARRSTFPPPPSRSSTFDQKLPPYLKNDPLPQSPRVSTIGEDHSGEVSRAVTPI